MEDTVQQHQIVSREQWIAARKAHLAHEKELSQARERLAEQRRALPWVKVDKNYVFDGPNGKVTLGDLFGGRPQLVVQHVMFAPDWEAACKSCSFWADGLDRMVPHLAARDTSTVAISLAPSRQARGLQEADGLDLRLGLVRKQRLQLRLRGLVHARADRQGRARNTISAPRRSTVRSCPVSACSTATRPARSSIPIHASRAVST